MTSENLDILIKFLSAGVIAALVAGIFSVITTVKTNKRLKEIELIKQKYDMKKIEYDRLESYYKELLQKGEEFEYKGKIEYTSEFVKQQFALRIQKFQFMQKEHEVHGFLFDDSENEKIKEKENIIDNDIEDFILKFKDGENIDKFAEYLEKIAIAIDKFAEDYHTLLKNKIRKILDK